MLLHLKIAISPLKGPESYNNVRKGCGYCAQNTRINTQNILVRIHIKESVGAGEVKVGNSIGNALVC